MNVKLLVDRVYSDPNLDIQKSSFFEPRFLSQEGSSYFVSAYYFKCPYIRFITPSVLLQEPKVIRDRDIPSFAYDFILEQGLSFFISEPGSQYAILKPLQDKKFLTFGSQRSLPFGLTNFLSPRLNLLNITRSFQYNDPILVVEGLRDCCDAQTIYPFTICTQTDSIPSLMKQVLSTLTSHLILALDNDERGQKGICNLLYKEEFDYKVFQYPDGYKDIGTLSSLYLVDSFRYDFYKDYIGSQLSVLVK